MPSLPRLNRPREAVSPAAPAAVPEVSSPGVEEISSAGLRWFNVEQPGSLEQAWLQKLGQQVRACVRAFVAYLP